MILSRRNFLLTAGSALAGAVFVPKYERWFGAVPQVDYTDSIKYTSYALGFQISTEMVQDDLYQLIQKHQYQLNAHWARALDSHLYVRQA